MPHFRSSHLMRQSLSLSLSFSLSHFPPRRNNFKPLRHLGGGGYERKKSFGRSLYPKSVNYWGNKIVTNALSLSRYEYLFLSLPPSLSSNITLRSSDIMWQGCPPHLNHMWVNEVLSELCYRFGTRRPGTLPYNKSRLENCLGVLYRLLSPAAAVSLLKKIGSCGIHGLPPSKSNRSDTGRCALCRNL